MNNVPEVVEFCESLLEKIEELPDEAEDFSDSVRRRVEGILEWVEDKQTFTQNQRRALYNIDDGVERWLERVN